MMPEIKAEHDVSEAETLLRSPELRIIETLAGKLLDSVRTRHGQHCEDPPSSQVGMRGLLKEVTPGDLSVAWKETENSIVQAFGEVLSRLNSVDGCLSANEFNSKFGSDDFFEGKFLGLQEFKEGVEGSLGLPGKDIFEGMKMEFDSDETITTSNYGNTETKRRVEWDFVVDPSQSKEYAGKRRPTPLKIFLYAAAAKKKNQDADARYEHLSDLNDDLKDGVNTVLLRRVKEAGLSKSILKASAAKDPTLKELAEWPEEKLKTLRKDIGRVLRSPTDKIPILEATGQPSFSKLKAEIVEHCGLKVAVLHSLLDSVRASLKEANLLEEEVIALRLYTGPAFMKLNGTLRGATNTDGETYVCTIFAAISGMTKLAGISNLPEGRQVYRGLKGMRLPEQFYEENDRGVRGGVEMAFLSTTTEMEVAANYAAEGGKLPTVFSIQVGAVDNGAALGFLSQYPNEDEVVGKPTVIPSEKGAVLSFPMKINCNLQSPTLEKLKMARQTGLITILNHVKKEVVRDVDALMKQPEFKQRKEEDLDWRYRPHHGTEFIESIKKDAQIELERVRGLAPSEFLSDSFYRNSVSAALDIQRQIMNKLNLWMCEKIFTVGILKRMPLRDADRLGASTWRRKIEEAKEAGKDTSGLSLDLCKHMGLVDQSEREIEHIVLVDPSEKEHEKRVQLENALIEQAAEGSPSSVGLLLAAKASVDSCREDKATALLLAARAGYEGVVKLLLEQKADPSLPEDKRNSTALIAAAENGHAGILRQLLETGSESTKDYIVAKMKSGHDALHAAAEKGFGKAVGLLLDHGADVEAKGNNGRNALMSASRNGHFEVVKKLVEGKANVNAKDTEGWTALMKAAQNNYLHVAKFLEEKGADVNSTGIDGVTAVMVAARHRDSAEDESVLRWLVNGAGAEIEVKDNMGFSLLMYASKKKTGEYTDVDAQQATKRRNLVIWLLERRGGSKVDVEATTITGATVLMMTAGSGDKHLVEILVKQGQARVGAVCNMGWSAAHCALYAKNEELAKSLTNVDSDLATLGEQLDFDEVKREVKSYCNSGLRVLIGSPWLTNIDKSKRTVVFGGLASMKYQKCAKGYYELELMDEVAGPKFGFVSGKWPEGCSSVDQVGSKPMSWAVASNFVLMEGKEQKSKSAEWKGGCEWKIGDVIGLYVDMHSAPPTIQFSRNGEPYGVEIKLDKEFAGNTDARALFPAFSVMSGTVRYNFGEDPSFPFRYQPQPA